MTMPFTHKKDEVRATGTLEARTPGDQAVQVLLYVIIALVALAFGLALYKTIDNKRRGKSCGGNCSACGAACSRRK